MILVSACLLGYPCRYDGLTTPSAELMERLGNESIIAVCPEQLGGLPTPRPPADIMGPDGGAVLNGQAKVVDRTDTDRTDAFLHGARCVLALAEQVQATAVYLKNRSPSCAVQSFVDKKGVQRGSGVTAAILTRAGFEVIEVTASTGGGQLAEKNI